MVLVAFIQGKAVLACLFPQNRSVKSGFLLLDADEIGEDYNNPRRRSMNTLQLILTLPGTSALAVVLFRRVNPPPAPGYPQRGNTRKDARFPVSANTCASPTRCRDTRAIPGMGIGGRKTGD